MTCFKRCITWAILWLLPTPKEGSSQKLVLHECSKSYCTVAPTWIDVTTKLYYGYWKLQRYSKVTTTYCWEYLYRYYTVAWTCTCSKQGIVWKQVIQHKSQEREFWMCMMCCTVQMLTWVNSFGIPNISFLHCIVTYCYGTSQMKMMAHV